MPNIKLLDKSVAELIAAGEVVERPASIIKELVENAIDAGASRIQVEIKNGGVRYIRVTDDGCGIPFDEMPTAFLRHATSKISIAEDLDAIMTLGFRGEALASIAAMCKVDLLSRQPSGDMGGRYSIEGGEELLHESAGGPVGTTIVVRDIFFNTPARMKFLKKDTTESALVTQTLEWLALINSSVSFSYIRDGKRIFTTPGDGLLLSSVSVILPDIANSLIPVEYSSDGISVTGFITSPDTPRASRAMQYFYINGRYVQSRVLTGALEEAFKHRLMGGKFPGCVLNLEIRPSVVDVNVHPKKIEVRFSDEKAIYNVLYSACRAALEPKTPIPKASPALSVFALKDFDHTHLQQKLTAPEKALPPKTEEVTVISGELKPKAQEHPAERIPRVSGVFREAEQAFAKIPADGNLKFSSSMGQAVILREKPAVTPATEPFKAPKVSPEIAIDNANTPPEIQEYKVVGELFATYILVERSGAFIMIDKHAAHERYQYNRLLENPLEIERQTLIAPVAVQLPKTEYASAVENTNLFLDMGIVIDDFGDGTVIVRELPMILAGCDVSAVISEIAAAIMMNKRDLTPAFAASILASVACRSSVMKGDLSSRGELEFIAKLVLEKGITNCPHGRPTSKKFTKSEIERMFGRLT